MNRRMFFGLLPLLGLLRKAKAGPAQWDVTIETGPSYTSGVAIAHAARWETWMDKDGHHFYSDRVLRPEPGIYPTMAFTPAIIVSGWRLIRINPE